MRFVPVKDVEQQAVLSVQRVRQGFVEKGTATIHRVRDVLSEFGIVLPPKSATVRQLGRMCFAVLRHGADYGAARVNRKLARETYALPA